MFSGLKCAILNGPPNRLIKPFEKNGQKRCLKNLMFRFQVFGIQKVTVFKKQENKLKTESISLESHRPCKC